MQTASAAFTNLLNTATSISAKARVIAEWNHNRYTPISYMDNSLKDEATYGFDLEMYPFESITESPRPTAGIMKARTDQRLPIRDFSDSPPNPRVYTADYDSKYKYWMSPDASDNYYTNAQQTMLRIQNCRPTITYAAPAWSNKIYLCFETGWTRPTEFQVQITTNGTTWSTVATNPAIDSKGRVQLWRRADGGWSATKDLDNPVQLRGVRVNITSVNRMYARVSMIEMGLRLERDLSSYLTGFSVENTMSESDFITPMGTISSNTGSVTLSNVDQTFNHENTNSMYYGLLDANVLFTIESGIDVGGGVYEYIRQATMYSESWEGDYEVTVTIKDASKFLQEVQPNKMLMENVTIGKAIWRLLDSVGFNDYAYTRAAADAPSLINYYWTDGEGTVWDTIQEICRTTQTAAYFDEYGVLQIKTRSAMYDKTQPIKWALSGNNSGSTLANIIDITPTSTYEANSVNVNYQKTTLIENNLGEPMLETVWEPGAEVRGPDGQIIASETDTFVLRAAALRSSMDATQNYFYIAANQTASWPYEGLVNIRGELIKYHGKQYAWYDGAGARRYDWLYSTEDKLRYDRELSGAAYRQYNFFTGAFLITERGYDYTEPQAHSVDINGWRANAFYGQHGGGQTQWSGGVHHVPHLSSLRLQTNGNFGSGMWYCAHRPLGQAMNYFGTRLRFPSNPRGTEQSGGLFFYGDDADRANMYAIDITSTARMEHGDRRLSGNEIRFFRRKNGNIFQFAVLPTADAAVSFAQRSLGAAQAIGDDQWVDIDVHAQAGRIQVWVNGKLTFDVADPDPVPASERMGLYVRGNTVADFEYFYALKSGARVDSVPDEQSFMDIVDGGYYSNQYYKDVLWDWRNVKKKRGKKTVTQKQKYADRYMDEFGIVVHEAREYDVVFSKAPVLKSILDFSNTKEVVVDQYIHSPFGAKFIIANAARSNAILTGEDLKSQRDQYFDIIGRTVQQREEQTYTVKDEQAIRARGEIEVEIDSRWIQSEGAARDLGNWIVNNWAETSENVETTVFGNPLFQIGDLVSVDYAPKNMLPGTHKYFVIAVTHGWDKGPTTSLSLRRARV